MHLSAKCTVVHPFNPRIHSCTTVLPSLRLLHLLRQVTFEKINKSVKSTVEKAHGERKGFFFDHVTHVIHYI